MGKTPESTAGTNANDQPRRENACEVTWGNCDERNPTYFGKPTGTPHTCKGVRKHRSKLHVCEKCGCVGHPIKPLAFTKAGRQLRALVLAHAQYQAIQKAMRYVVRANNPDQLGEIPQPPHEI